MVRGIAGQLSRLHKWYVELGLTSKQADDDYLDWEGKLNGGKKITWNGSYY